MEGVAFTAECYQAPDEGGSYVGELKPRQAVKKKHRERRLTVVGFLSWSVGAREQKENHCKVPATKKADMEQPMGNSRKSSKTAG